MKGKIRLMDATTISRVGSRGTDRRVHLGMELGTNRTDWLELTDGRGAESLERFTFSAGEIVLGDRGYAQRKGLRHVAKAGAYFVVRMPWSTLPLEHEDGEPFELLAALRSLPEARAGQFAVQFRSAQGERIGCRMVAIRKSEAAAAKARQRALLDARRHGAKAVNAGTLEAAGYVFVLTNLPAEISAESVLDLYRFRWQVEIKFKSLKSVLHLGNVPARSNALLNVYIMAKLLIALLIEDLIFTDSFSPWGYPIPPDQLLAPDPTPA
jgi:IS4 transposase